MNCGQVEKLLTDDLWAASNPEVREHIRQCEACAELRRQLKQIDELNQALARRCEAPMDFSGKIASQVHRRRSWSGFSTLAAVLALLLIATAALNWRGGFQNSLHSASPTFSMVEDSPGDDFGVTINEEAPRPHRPYVEVILLEPSGDPYVVQIPSTIKIRRADAARGALLKVSH